MTSAWRYAKAFQKNCPGVRMTEDEADELARLFWVAQKEAHGVGADNMRRAIEDSGKDAA